MIPRRVESLTLTEKAGATRFEVLVKPRASKSAIRGERNGALDVAIAAPPVDGAANEELVRVIARALDVAPKTVAIAHGAASRTKVVEVRGLSPADVRARLGARRA